MMRLKLRGLVEGACNARPLLALAGPLNLYGDVDPELGVYRPAGVSISGRVLIVRSFVGSTVAPYVAYALRRRGLGPCGVVVEDVDGVAVASAVLGGFALAKADRGQLAALLAGVRRQPGPCLATLVSRPPGAELAVSCRARPPDA